MENEKHLEFEQIYDYIEAEEITIDNYDWIYGIDCHIAECDECLAKIQYIEELNTIINEWTPEKHGAMYRESIENSKVLLKDGWAERIQKWIENYSGKAEAAAKVFLAVEVNNNPITKIITDGIEEILMPKARYNFIPVSAAIGTRGGSAKRQNNNPKNLKDENTGSKISVNGSNKTITVELGDLKPEKLPLVILIPENEEEMPIVAEPVEKENKWVVHFEEVPKGEYTLVIEPMEF